MGRRAAASCRAAFVEASLAYARRRKVWPPCASAIIAGQAADGAPGCGSRPQPGHVPA